MQKPPSVLVVDDEPLIAMLVADWLGELGFQVVGPAGSAAEALPHIETGQLDAILLDVTLGAGDSFPLAEKAQARGLRVAFLTGRSALDLPAQFKGLPVLTKPFEFTAIEALMGKLLGSSKASEGAGQ